PQYTLSHTPAPATASQPCTSYQTRPTTSSSSFLYSLPRRPPSSTLFPYTTLFRSISIVELADSIRYPMPTLDATVSEMTEPTKARVIATLSDAKKYGMERGRATFFRISMRLAPSERITSCSSGSSVARPVAIFTTTGKNEIRNAVTIAGTVPMPNQTTSTGTKATFGMLLKPTING